MIVQQSDQVPMTCWFRRLIVAGMVGLLCGGLGIGRPTPALAQDVCPPAADQPTGEIEGRVDSGGLERGYLLYVPPTLDLAAPAPLVLSFHGAGGSAGQQRDLTLWNALADEEGVIVVYPQGTGLPRTFNVTTTVMRNDVNDMDYTRVLIAHLAALYCVDPARIYASGISNGGAMSIGLACALADVIAAVGSVAGAYDTVLAEYIETCDAPRSVPTIAFHGTADHIAPYEGGPAFVFELLAYESWTQAWALRSGCDAVPEVLPVQGEVSGRRYVNCADEAEMRFYTIDGGGHTWPGGGAQVALIVGRTTDDIHATEAMWAFFQAHPLIRGE